MLCKKQIQTKSDVFETTYDIVQKANFALNEVIGSVAANEISPNSVSYTHLTLPTTPYV